MQRQPCERRGLIQAEAAVDDARHTLYPCRALPCQAVPRPCRAARRRRQRGACRPACQCPLHTHYRILQPAQVQRAEAALLPRGAEQPPAPRAAVVQREAAGAGDGDVTRVVRGAHGAERPARGEEGMRRDRVRDGEVVCIVAQRLGVLCTRPAAQELLSAGARLCAGLRGRVRRTKRNCCTPQPQSCAKQVTQCTSAFAHHQRSNVSPFATCARASKLTSCMRMQWCGRHALRGAPRARQGLCDEKQAVRPVQHVHLLTSRPPRSREVVAGPARPRKAELAQAARLARVCHQQPQARAVPAEQLCAALCRLRRRIRWRAAALRGWARGRALSLRGAHDGLQAAAGGRPEGKAAALVPHCQSLHARCSDPVACAAVC